MTHLPSGKAITRTDELGYFIYRYTDDGGATWSPELYNITTRQTAIDRNNSFNGKTSIFWNVDQFKHRGNDTYAMFTKINQYVQNPPEQGFILHSPNAMTELDASKIVWDFLPDGDEGPGCPQGFDPAATVAEEWHVLPLLNSSGFYAVFRTNIGLLGAAQTADPTGKTGWGASSYARFQQPPLPGSASNITSSLKNPRGPITVKRFSNGLYLMLWFNNGADSYQTQVTASISSRNPYWLSSGIEVDGSIVFSQPEIVLYIDGSHATADSRIGYPDFIEDVDGSIWISETDKATARVHRIDEHLLTNLFGQFTVNSVATDDALFSIASPANGSSTNLPSTSWPDLSNQTAHCGFSIDMWVEGQGERSLFASSSGRNAISIVQASTGAISLQATQDNITTTLTTDLACTNALAIAGQHYIAFTVDAAARVVTVMVDGKLCDGSLVSTRGWGWLEDAQTEVQGGDTATFGPGIQLIRMYGRALYTSEALGNFRAGV